MLAQTVESSTWPGLPLRLSQGKAARKFSAAGCGVVSRRAHYQAGVTACGAPARPVSNGTETSTLLPLFSSGLSGARRGLLILVCNGKRIATSFNLEPLLTARWIEGSRSLCLIYKRCVGETGQRNLVVKIHAGFESMH